MIRGSMESVSGLVKLRRQVTMTVLPCLFLLDFGVKEKVMMIIDNVDECYGGNEEDAD